MEIVFTVLLTIFLVFAIIKIVDVFKIKKQNTGMFSQSQMHSLLKFFMPSEVLQKNKTYSQLEKYKDKNKIKAIIIDDIAYWISDNIFYTADVVDGEIMSENATKVNIDNVSEQEIEKLLFILDNLRDNEQ